MFCQNCKSEFIDEITICSDCGANLVEKLGEQHYNQPEYDHEVFLTSVNDGIEADMIESLLKSNNIPVLKRFKGTGAYIKIYMGNSIQGVDLYVPSKSYQLAQEIISGKPLLEDIPVPLDNEDDIEYEIEKSRRFRSLGSWLIFIILFPGILITIISLIRSFIS